LVRRGSQPAPPATGLLPGGHRVRPACTVGEDDARNPVMRVSHPVQT